MSNSISHSEDLLRDVVREQLLHSHDNMSLNEALITEGLDGDMVKDAIQFVVAGAAEYGLGAITMPAAGAGLAVGPTVETMVDGAFTAGEITSGVSAVAGIGGQMKEFGSLWDEAKSAYSGDLEAYYDKLVEVVKKVLSTLGKKAKGTIEDVAEKIRETISKVINAIVDTLSSGLKIIIPDAALGTAIATGFEEVMDALAENAYSLLTKAINKVKLLKDFIADPSIAVGFFEDVFKQVIKMMRKTADIMKGGESKEDEGLFKKVAKFAIKGAIPGLAAFDIAKSLGGKGLSKAADVMEKQLPKLMKIIDSVLTVLIPAAITALGLFQILMKGDWKEDEGEESKEGEKEKGAEKKETKTESTQWVTETMLRNIIRESLE